LWKGDTDAPLFPRKVPVTAQDPNAQKKPLELYGRDLTELAREGKLDPVIGAMTKSVAPSRS